MRTLLLAPILAIVLAGCATSPVEHNYVTNDVTQFAFELGATHASLANCPKASAVALNDHLVSAQILLKSQKGPGNIEMAFLQGLAHPEGKPSNLVIDCECVDSLINQSRLHNLDIYRTSVLPLVNTKVRYSTN